MSKKEAFRCVEENDLNGFRRVLSEKKFGINDDGGQYYDDDTLLTESCYKGRLEFVKILLKRDDIDVNKYDDVQYRLKLEVDSQKKEKEEMQRKYERAKLEHQKYTKNIGRDRLKVFKIPLNEIDLGQNPVLLGTGGFGRVFEVEWNFRRIIAVKEVQLHIRLYTS